MANLIQNNSKLIEQQRNQNSTIESVPSVVPIINKVTIEDSRTPKTVRIIKDQSGFGFNVRGQISGEFLIRSCPSF